MAIDSALSFVRSQTHPYNVPLHLRNAPTRLMEELGYSKGYKYAHDFKGDFVDLEFMPEGMEGKTFYHPNTENAAEAKIAERLRQLWKDKYNN